MLDYSTWGDAWGFSWGDAWGCVEADEQRRVGGDDAPLRPTDEEWVKNPWQFGKSRAEAYEAAQEAIELAEEEPNKETIEAAELAVERITDPYAAPVLRKSKKIDTRRLEQATKRLADIEAAYEAYKVAKRREEEAVIALLFAI
ncbi:MAG: hypothetical protein AAFR73_12720 [Pseudomonadota bacterium]